MTTAVSIDPTSFTGKRVTLTFQDESDDLKEVVQEGKVELGTTDGVMFKKRGSSGVQLIEAKHLINIAELASKESNVTVKKLQPIAAGRVRQHLVDRHGYPVADANKITEQAAQEYHDDLDHTGLGHVHVVPQAEADAADASDDSDDDLTAEG